MTGGDQCGEITAGRREPNGRPLGSQESGSFSLFGHRLEGPVKIGRLLAGPDFLGHGHKPLMAFGVGDFGLFLFRFAYHATFLTY